MTGNPLGLALLAVVGPGVLGLLGWAGYCFARWYRADAETRISLRQARRVRWGWKRLAPMLGLAVKDTTPTVLQQYGPQEQPTKPRVLLPRLHTRADAFGVTVTADALPQVGLSAWQDANEGLCDAWGMRRIRISQPKPGVIVARGFRREPLDAVIRSPLLGPEGSPVCRPGQFVSTDDVLLGWDEDGSPIVLNLAYSAHALIAGLTRSGKSITVNTLLAYASLMRDVRLIVIDPNLGAVAPWWRTAYKVSEAIHPDKPTEILRWVREEMQRRERLFWSGRTDRITDFSPELPLLLVVIDEVANYTRHPDRKARERFEAELLAIASQGAKFGIRLWLLTQKPSADVLTTAVRTNLSARICHRVDTVEDFLHLFPDGRELDITAADRTMPQGVSIASVGDMRTPVRLRSVYLPTEACWQINDLMCAEGLRKEAGVGWRDSGLAFTTPTGRPLDPANLTRRFRSFLDRAGLRRIRFHDLRHSTATLLLEQGVDLVVIKELLGHAHIGVTAGVYAHVRLRLQRQAIDTLGSALGQTDDGPDDPPAAAVVR